MFKKLLNTSTNTQKGSVLTVSLIVMVVLVASVSLISQVTANQLTNTSITINNTNNENTGKTLIRQSIAEFEAFLDPLLVPDGDIDSTEFAALITNFSVKYDVNVTNVTGSLGFEDFGVTELGESRAYRFAYTLDNGNELVMYSYLSTVGTATDNLDPFSFSLATNGDLILNGGYYRDAAFFGKNIRYGFVAPYMNRATLLPTLTPEFTLSWAISKNYFPDFNGNGTSADVYYTDSYTYCPSTCFEVSTDPNDNFVIEESLYYNIEGSGLETGVINGDKIISDFFGSFSLNDTIINYVKTIGPTDDLEILDAMTPATIGSVVLANSGNPTASCTFIKIRGRWVEVCSLFGSELPYTNVTYEPSFDPENEEEFIEYGAVYDGDLIINHDFIIDDIEGETFVVTGDLTFQNTTDILFEGVIVVLGDLLFEGETVGISGGFYVMGESRFNFDENEGIENIGAHANWSFALYSKKSIIVESMWESHRLNARTEQFDWFAYTEESIYIDAVNSAIEINGVLFAHAKGNYPPYIVLEDSSAVQIHGILINSFNGYINTSGIAVENKNLERFYLDVINEGNLQSTFIELPTFDTVIVSEGTYSFDTSEFYLE